MEDGEVIDSFLDGSAGATFGPSLHVEQDTLKLDGWWSIAYRVSDRTVILRDEETPMPSTVAADLAAALTARGLAAVGSDLPAITLLTYTNLDLGYAPWVLWSTDLDSGESDLNAKAMQETSLQEPSPGSVAEGSGDPAHIRGARRTAGTATRVVLTVGLTDVQTMALSTGLADCRLERRGFDEIEAGDCAPLLPTLVLVDATGSVGSAFVVALQADPIISGPVVAIVDGAETAAGADATVDAADAPERWLPLLGDLMV